MLSEPKWKGQLALSAQACFGPGLVGHNERYARLKRPKSQSFQAGEQLHTQCDQGIKDKCKMTPPATNGRQREPSMGTRGDKGRQGETRGDKDRQGETRGDKTLGKADTPPNKGKQEGIQGDKGRQGETRPSGRRTHHPTQAHGRQGETRGDKGRQGETRGDKGRQGETRGDKGRQGQTRADKGRQDPREGGRTIQHRHTCGETVGDKGRQEAREGTHHPTRAHMWGDSGRQGEARKTLGKADTASNTGTHVGRQWETRGDSGRQGETRGDKTFGKADTPSNTGTHVSLKRQEGNWVKKRFHQIRQIILQDQYHSIPKFQ